MMSGKEILDESARYKYVVENIKDVIWELDSNAIFTFVSSTVKGFGGYDVDQMVGRCLLDFLTDESRKFIQNQLKEKRNKWTSGVIHNSPLYDVEFICEDGRTIWCEVCVKPIIKDNKLVGYIGTTRDISEKKMYEKKLQEMLAGQKHINEQLEDLLTFDMLTGAYNRRKFEYFIGEEIEKAEKYGTPFSISIFDVDNFKQINDMYGHNNGDRVLKDIAALIKHTLRSTDKLFRWGGDEFIILFPNVNLKNALKVADKIRKVVQSYEFALETKRVSVSLGVGTYAPTETPEQFVLRVDQALLRAKSNGKNLVEQG